MHEAGWGGTIPQDKNIFRESLAGEKVQTLEMMKTFSQAHLIKYGLYLIEERLGSDLLDVVLLEVDALMIKRFQVVFLILLSPDFVELALGFSPLLLLGLQSEKETQVVLLHWFLNATQRVMMVLGCEHITLA